MRFFSHWGMSVHLNRTNRSLTGMLHVSVSRSCLINRPMGTRSMSMSIVKAAELLPEELQMLGENVVHAVANDGQGELAAVNRSLAVHGENVGELICPASDGRAA
jgi:hypothetical protein